ncbi:Serine/threonine protein kinase [Streptosporangium canum]|uniref:non-specific serine/threonine protein kinase n=1 Tax=Streptosporangium canum TaxID=324952 RepID=A0A1I3IQ92_9ACTN|nr:serine/threonine-protein kinase [Streptosporangium canum]SFI50126.1 Serine/threonine protein kinase [Streptosporangium canum]
MADQPLPVLAGRYRALGRLGAGGMGVVWRAQDELLHREVAIKEVKLDPSLPEAQRTEMRERTLREARAAARLGHPSIVAVHDVVAQDGRPWIVMDLIRGRSLSQAIRQDGPLPAERAAAIGLAVLDALTLAHSRGIMHRDVKPANIMLAHDGGVLLTDFGIATLEGDVQLTSPDALVGSPGYMAPERLRGTGDGPAADLWSLGATLYTAVEGQSPFQRGVPVATLGAVLTEETPTPSRAGALAPVLLAMLVKDPRDRPGAAVLRTALHRVAQGLPAGPLSPQSPRAPAREKPAPPGPRRTGWLVGAGLAVVAAGVTAAVLLTAGGSQTPSASPTGPDPRIGRFATAPDPCGLLSGAQSRAVVPSGSPSGREAKGDAEAYCSWDGPVGARWLRVALGHQTPTPGKSGPDTAHAFFAAERIKIKADEGTHLVGSVGPLRTVDRIGAEAFAYDVRALDRIHSVIRFRVSNLLIEVNLSEKGKRATTELRQHTLRTARLIAEELNRRD